MTPFSRHEYAPGTRSVQRVRERAAMPHWLRELIPRSLTQPNLRDK